MSSTTEYPATNDANQLLNILAWLDTTKQKTEGGSAVPSETAQNLEIARTQLQHKLEGMTESRLGEARLRFEEKKPGSKEALIKIQATRIEELRLESKASLITLQAERAQWNRCTDVLEQSEASLKRRRDALKDDLAEVRQALANEKACHNKTSKTLDRTFTTAVLCALTTLALSIALYSFA